MQSTSTNLTPSLTDNVSAQPKSPLPAAEASTTIERFHRDGFAIVRSVLNRDECDFLRRRTDEIAADPTLNDVTKKNSYSFVITNPLEYERAFADLFIREPILSLVQTILGPDCRFSGQSIIRNRPGESVSRWHLDDANQVDYPLPENVPRWDARVHMPVLWLSVQIPLTDILTQEDGPTEVVPGSHYSGRLPISQDQPVFEGKSAEPVFCNAGDIYLFNHQVWHRGSPNLSQNTRYLLQLQYARGDRFAVRCQGAKRSPAIEKILDDGDPRLASIFAESPKYV